MFMTIEEAAEKWCPQVRFGDEVGASFNRGFNDPMNHPEKSEDWVPRCIGSACMMWRWKTGTVPGFIRFTEALHRVTAEEPSLSAFGKPAREQYNVPGNYVWKASDGTEPAGWRESNDGTQNRRVGYCGLAGKPEVA